MMSINLPSDGLTKSFLNKCCIIFICILSSVGCGSSFVGSNPTANTGNNQSPTDPSQGDQGFHLAGDRLYTNFQIEKGVSDDYIYQTQMQSDGKIVYVGYSTANSSRDILVGRFNSDGTPDLSFNGVGYTIFDLDGSLSPDEGRAVQLQSDGKLVVAALIDLAGIDDIIYLVRFNTDGTFDSTFGVYGTGIIKTDLRFVDSHKNIPLAVDQLSDRIAVGGDPNIGLNYTYSAGIRVFSRDANVDPNYSNYGSKTNATIPFTELDTLGFDSNGFLVASISGYNSSSQARFWVRRFNLTGGSDSSFGSGGVYEYASGYKAVTSTFDAVGNQLFLGDGPKILTVGSTGALVSGITVPNSSLLVRNFKFLDSGMFYISAYSTLNGTTDKFYALSYNSDGSLNASFGTSGKAEVVFGSGTSLDQVRQIEVQNDGKLVLLGNTNFHGTNDLALARLSTSGALDSSFNTTGKQTYDLDAGTADVLMATRVQSDGKVISAGYSNLRSVNLARTVLVRYNTDGSLDSTFNGSGKVITTINNSSSEIIYDMQLQSDGKIVVAGRSELTNKDVLISRYNIDGSLDSSFGTSGIQLLDLNNSSSDTAKKIVIDGNSIWIAGETTSSGTQDAFLLKLNESGNLDSSFNSNGKLVFEMKTSVDDYVADLKIRSDGKIILAGYTSLNNGNGDIALVRLNMDGSFDSSFNSSGKYNADIGTNSNDEISAMQIQSDGKIILLGKTNKFGTFDLILLRFTNTGTLDPTFGDSGTMGGPGVFLTGIESNSNSKGGIQIQSDGKITFAGFQRIGNEGKFAFLRLNGDGRIDTTYNSVGIKTIGMGTLLDTVNDLQILPNGKYLISGSSYGKNLSFDFAHLLLDK